MNPEHVLTGAHCALHTGGAECQEYHCSDEQCALAGAAQCGAPPTIRLAEARERFAREAVAGVCDTGRYRCRYHVWGKGPPLLCIPGLADDAGSFLLVAARLSAHFRSILYDMPTGGADGARLARYTHADLVADVWALFDHLHVEQAYVLGSSFGATVALAALREQPARLRRAVLQGGFARRPLARAERTLAWSARWWPGSLGRLPIRKTILHYNHAGPFAERGPEVWEYFLARSHGLPIRALAYRARLLHGVDLRGILSEVHQPVLLVCGQSDPLVSRTCESELLEGLPSAGRVELPGAGHHPLFTHPELLAEVVRRFLTPPAMRS
jgi:3-oxoadipate enol-lactonase